MHIEIENRIIKDLKILKNIILLFKKNLIILKKFNYQMIIII